MGYLTDFWVIVSKLGEFEIILVIAADAVDHDDGAPVLNKPFIKSQSALQREKEIA